MAFKLLPEKPGKYDKRVLPFSAVCTDIKIQEGFGDDYKLVLEFGDEPVLALNLKYNTWVATEDGKSPKPSSLLHRFLASIMKQGVEFPVFDVENYEVVSAPSLLGKELTFDCQSKTFPTEDGETKTYYIWTLKQVGGGKQAKAPAQPEQQKEAAPADMVEVKRVWLELINALPEKFTFPQMLAEKNKRIAEMSLGVAEKEFFTVAKKIKAMFSSMETEGYVSQKGSEYVKNDEMILTGLMA